MKINSSIKRKRLFIAAAVLTVLVLGSGLYLLTQNLSTPKNEKVTSSTSNGSDKGVGEVDYSAPSTDQENPTLDDQPFVSDTTTTDPLTVSVSYIGGNPLQARILINELLSSGNCELTLKKEGAEPVTMTAAAFPASSYTTCQGFTIDTAAMAKGTWKASIKVTSGTRSGTAETTLEVQ